MFKYIKDLKIGDVFNGNIPFQEKENYLYKVIGFVEVDSSNLKVLCLNGPNHSYGYWTMHKLSPSYDLGLMRIQILNARPRLPEWF